MKPSRLSLATMRCCAGARPARTRISRDARFGVKAIGNDGTESLVAPYVYPAREKVVYETVQ